MNDPAIKFTGRARHLPTEERVRLSLRGFAIDDSVDTSLLDICAAMGTISKFQPMFGLAGSSDQLHLAYAIDDRPTDYSRANPGCTIRPCCRFGPVAGTRQHQ